MKEAARTCGNAVASLSLGQYHTKLYHSGSKAMHSSLCGGLLTLFLFVPLFVYSILLLYSTLSKANYTSVESTQDIYRKVLTLANLTDSVFNQTFEVKYSQRPPDLACSSIRFFILYPEIRGTFAEIANFTFKEDPTGRCVLHPADYKYDN